MVDFENMLRKIKDLGGEYKEEIGAGKEEKSAMKKENEATARYCYGKDKEIGGRANPGYAIPGRKPNRRNQ